MAVKKVLIFGLGLTGGGFASALYFLNKGCEVRVTDLKNDDSIKDSVAELVKRGCTCITGEHRQEDFEWADLVIKNPAISPDNPYLAYAHKISNDISFLLDSPLVKGIKLVAVTGTKGKTTTTAAVYHVLKEMNYDVMQCGNMGISAFTVLSELEKRYDQKIRMPDYIIFELSSWQIRDTSQYCRKAATVSFRLLALTSIFEDHLNTYKDFDAYLNDKLDLFSFKSGTIVVPEQIKARLLKKTRVKESHIKVIDRLVDDDFPYHASLRTAYAILIALKIRKSYVTKHIATFQGVPHRNELIGNIGNTFFINDSTATIPEAVLFTFSNYSNELVHLITGGTDKALKPDVMLDICRKCKSLQLLDGTFTRNKLMPLLDANGVSYDGPFGSMKEAFDCAYSHSKETSDKVQFVLLSPACASFGIFVNEFDRGDQFRQCFNDEYIKQM